ncbi:MAG: hypothetical protein R3C56_07820 [Pirellulaceae bacterium]
MSVENNISLSNIGLIEKFRFLNRAAERRHAKTYVDQLSIKTPSVRQATKAAQWRESTEGGVGPCAQHEATCALAGRTYTWN